MYDREIGKPGKCPFRNTQRAFGGDFRECEGAACEVFLVTEKDEAGKAVRGRCGLMNVPEETAAAADATAADAQGTLGLTDTDKGGEQDDAGGKKKKA